MEGCKVKTYYNLKYQLNFQKIASCITENLHLGSRSRKSGPARGW